MSKEFIPLWAAQEHPKPWDLKVWSKRNLSHWEKVENMKSAVDTKAPINYAHLLEQNKRFGKQRVIGKQKVAEIEYRNLQLLKRLNKIKGEKDYIRYIRYGGRRLKRQSSWPKGSAGTSATTAMESGTINLPAINIYGTPRLVTKNNHDADSGRDSRSSASTLQSQHTSLDSAISVPELKHLTKFPSIQLGKPQSAKTPKPGKSAATLLPRQSSLPELKPLKVGAAKPTITRRISLPSVDAIEDSLVAKLKKKKKRRTKFLEKEKSDSKVRMDPIISCRKATPKHPPWRGSSKASGMQSKTNENSVKVEKLELERSNSLIFDDISPCSTPSPNLSDVEDSDFEADYDSRLIYKILRNTECVDEVLFEALGKTNYQGRMQIKAEFEQQFGYNLESWLTDLIGPEYECLIQAFLERKEMRYANELKSLLDEPTKNVKQIIEILTVHNEVTVAEIKAAYVQLIQRPLDEDIKSKCHSQLNEFLQMLVMDEQDKSAPWDGKNLGLDQKELFDLIRNGKWNSENRKFVKLLETSYSRLRNVLTNYFVASSNDDTLVNIEQHDSSTQFVSAVDAFVICAWSPHTLYAKKLFENFTVDSPVFLDAFISRAQVDLAAVSKAYETKYERCLLDDLSDHYPSETKYILINMLNYAIDQSLRTELNTEKNQLKAQWASERLPLENAIDVLSPSHIFTEDVTEEGSKLLQKELWHLLPKREKDRYIGLLSNEMELKQKNRLLMKRDYDGLTPRQVYGSVATMVPSQSEFSRDSPDSVAWRIDSVANVYKGTVHPQADFNLETVVRKLQSCLEEHYDGHAEAVLRILCNCSNTQRVQLKVAYEQLFKKDIGNVFKNRLPGDVSDCALLLMLRPVTLAAHACKQAFVVYGNDLKRTISTMCEGKEKIMLLTMLDSNRSTICEVDRSAAWQDAEKLINDLTAHGYPRERLLLNILCNRHRYHVASVAQAYEKLAGHSISEKVRRIFKGAIKACLLSLIRWLKDPVDFSARMLRTLICDASSPDWFTVCYLIINRSEVDLLSVKECYESLFAVALEDDIKKRPDDYQRKMLLMLLEKNQNI